MTTKRPPLFERLKEGLEEGIAHAKGEVSLRTIEVPEEPPEIDAETLAALRAQTEMSQALFAKLLSVSPRTVRNWEQGVRSPSEASRRLIQIFSQHPDVVCKTVGLPEIKLTGVRIKSGASGGRRIVVEHRPKRRKATASS